MEFLALNSLNHLENGVTKLLQEVFKTKNCLYILGSGVSKQYSKMETDLAYQIFNDYCSIGIISCSKEKNNFLTNKLLHRHIEVSKNNVFSTFLEIIPDHFTKLITNIEYAKAYPKYNPEYKIFLKAHKGSTIIDMNYEGFALYYLSKYHNIIPLHGNAKQIYGNIEELKEDVLLYEINLQPYFDIKIYPGEKQSNAVLYPYKKLLSEKIFPKLEWLVIIGYSFARTNDGLNDSVLYEFIKENLERYKKINLMIINPNIDNFFELFASETSRLIILEAYWNYLTRSICKNIKNKGNITNIIREYFKLIN